MTWNPFDWTAGPFLALYVSIAVIVFLLGLRLQIDDRPGRARYPSIERPGIGLSRRRRAPPRRRGTAVPDVRQWRHHRYEGSRDHRHGPDAAGDSHGPTDPSAVPAWHDTTAVSDGDQATRRAGAGAPARVGILPDRRSDDVLPNDRAALCRAAPGVWDHQGDRGHRTAPSGRDFWSSFSSSQHSPASCWRCVRRGRGPARTF